MNDNTTDQTTDPTPAPGSETVELQVTKIVTGGAGLARHEGLTVFVPLTAPGDRVAARIVERKKKFAQAEVETVLEAGPDRREAPCPYYGECGGCDLQHLDDAAQRRIKTEIVADCFNRLGKLDVAALIEAPADDPAAFGTRNRIRLFRNPTGFYGLMKRGTHEVVPLESCLVMPEIFQRDILPWVRLLPPVDEVVIRLDGRGGWLASLYGPPARLKVLKKILASQPDGEAPAPGCLGLLFNNLPLWGRDYLVYEVAGHKYRAGAQAFFQSNLEVTGIAIATVREWLDELAADGSLGPMLADLFCGVGLFSLALADRFEKIVAIDNDPHAIRDAANNVQRDEAAAGKTVVRTGQLAVTLRDPDLASPEEWASGCCVVDPPRVGLGKDGVQSLLHARPRHVVYMSCDPATLARDCAALAAEGYAVRKVQVLDMFPQTGHVETVVLFGGNETGGGRENEMMPTTLNETLERQYLYTSSSFLTNLRDLADDEALRQPEPGGNCINWVAGHIVQHRVVTLRLLGGEAPFDEAKYERYRRGSEPVTGAAGSVPLAEMADDFTATRQPFFEAIRSAGEDLLGRKAPFSPLDDPEETVGSLVAGLLFHESYHIGQLGVLRRLLGRDGAIR